MNDVSVAVPSGVRVRAKRARRMRSIQDRLFDLAVQRWAEWLMAFYLPRTGALRPESAPDLVDAWAAVVRSSRSNTEHSDCVVARLLADERAGWDWAMSIHAIVLDYPRSWQIALFSCAMGRPQRVIAEATKISQQNVSVMITLLKMRLLPAICMLGTTERVCRNAFGTPTPRLRFP